MKLLWIAVLLTLPLSFGVSQDQEKEGDEKIKDTIKQIQEEAEKAEEGEAETEEESDEDSCSGCQAFGELFLDIFGELFWEYAVSIRFADYPYAENSDYFHNTSAFRYPREEKAISLQAATDLSTHLDGTYGNVNRISFQMTTLHANLYNQFIFASSEWFSVISLNGGLTLSIQNFLLSAFAGGYKLNILDNIILSFGLSSQFFLPGGFYLDLYNLNAVLNYKLNFVHWTVSLNYSFWRFSLGVGYKYSRFINSEYSGPSLKVCFWL
jgi:hypothetical protein